MNLAYNYYCIQSCCARQQYLKDLEKGKIILEQPDKEEQG